MQFMFKEISVRNFNNDCNFSHFSLYVFVVGGLVYQLTQFLGKDKPMGVKYK